ncbi:MAG: twin-arginine translocase TatA/TatE family subunit [Candidatus Saccharicenans sp.]|nr:MAG: twin-arginine translocase TatA/TatE family subunit [Candidatus Aminicenantes bacterium]HEK86214.1 twin-arginine translocase TatA/TatE family subunit [Candidatus Aminicenantes bacterium]
MFGSLGAPELLLILLIVVIIFGARKLPELGKSLGEGIRNFKKAVSSGKEEPHSDNNPKPPATN